MVPGRIFRDMRRCRLDLIIMRIEKFERLAVDSAFEIIFVHLSVQFVTIKRLQYMFITVTQDNRHLSDKVVCFSKLERLFTARVVIDHTPDRSQIATGRVTWQKTAMF